MISKPKWSTACLDWEERIVNKQSLIPFDALFPKVADIAERIFKELILVDVTDSPRVEDITLDWVFGFVRAIFGAYDPVEKKRLIREFFLLISKKNTKSTIAAGIMLIALILNSRQSAELIILAPTVEVAKNSFKPLCDFILADDELSEKLNISEHTKTVTHLGTGAFLKVVAAETDASAGKKAAWVLFDEVWIFGKRPKAATMFREAKGGLLSRPEGCVIYLSTQSDEPPAGIFKQLLDYARKVRDGIIVDNEFLPVLYEFPKSYIEKGDHLKPENFYITNPNLGVSVSYDTLVSEFRKAEIAGDSDRVDFLAKHLNVEIGMMLRSDRWAGADFWLTSAHKDKLFIESILDLSEICTVGFDGGGLDDLFGMAVIGRDKSDRSVWYCWNRAWAHPIALERRKENAPIYKDFEAQGDLVIVKNVGDDVNQAAKLCKRIYDAGKFPEKAAIGLDKLGMPSLQDGLLEEVPFELLIGVPQGFQLSGYVQTTERKVAEGKFRHSGQKMMNWCVGNAKGVYQGNAMTIRKQESGKGKIDPLIATFNAVALMSLNPEPPNQSYGVFFV